MTFGQLFYTYTPILQSLTSLFNKLLLFPKRVRKPVPEHSVTVLFSTELQKGPFKTTPSAHFVNTEFLRTNEVSGVPLIQIAMPP